MIRAFNNASFKTIAKGIVLSSAKDSSPQCQLKFRSFVSLRPAAVGRAGGGAGGQGQGQGQEGNANNVEGTNTHTHTYQSLNSSIVSQMGGPTFMTAVSQSTNHMNLNLNTSKRNFWSRSKAKNNNDVDSTVSSSDPSSSSSSPTAELSSPQQPDVSTTNDETIISTTDTTTQISFSPEDEMAKFEQSASRAIQTTADAAETATATSTTWQSTWWPHDQMIDLINYTHDISGLNYALTISAMTLAFRVIMVPLFIKAQRNSSRMAHVKPELDVLKEKVDALDPKDLKGQQRYAKEMQKLFQKYDVNPLRALALPFIQMPVFMSMFFALRKMPDVFPDKLVDGGILWFVDLNAPDPYYVLPIMSGATFLVMMELGKKQMLASSPEHGELMLNFFRGMSLLIIPVSTTFPTAVLCYWTANNSFSLVQSVALQNDSVKKMCGIWEMPKPVPGMETNQKGIMDMFQDSLEKQRKAQADKVKERIEMHNAAIEKKKKDRRRAKK
mmetsp:Transcript_6029/g.9050  ORF Transcript_6029/g.9050 Transcript_6029/m.9050 type:complete len:499 (+) Transcript_6029:728-2224(+)